MTGHAFARRIGVVTPERGRSGDAASRGARPGAFGEREERVGLVHTDSIRGLAATKQAYLTSWKQSLSSN
jgi:hypothetical protein